MPPVLYRRNEIRRYHGPRGALPGKTETGSNKRLCFQKEKETDAKRQTTSEEPQGNVDGNKVGIHFNGNRSLFFPLFLL